MNLAKRMDDLEDRNLGPREAVICWMKEAHQFDSLINYGHWLMEQPHDAYPLVRMPRQVVAAVRARNKEVPDRELQDQFYRAQKDVLFLFHLHSQINEHAAQTEEARQLRLDLLREKLRVLILRSHEVDRDQLVGESAPQARKRSTRARKMTPEEAALLKDIVDWPLEEGLLWAEVMSLKEAERLLAARYLGGECLLFPETPRALDDVLRALDGLYDIYEFVLDGQPSDVALDLARRLSVADSAMKPNPEASREVDPRVRPNTDRLAKRLAERFIARARAEALEQLGEADAAVTLIQDELRSNEAALSV